MRVAADPLVEADFVVSPGAGSGPMTTFDVNRNPREKGVPSSGYLEEYRCCFMI
jgi:hypothetical protein